MQAVGARNRKNLDMGAGYCRCQKQKKSGHGCWILERPKFGLYENIMGDLEKNGAKKVLQEFHQMCSRVVIPILFATNQSCNCKNSSQLQDTGHQGERLEPGLVLAVTSRYLATGSMFVPNTMSEVV